jgi:hypothetical protein
MVAAGKADVDMLNRNLKDYNTAIYGKIDKQATKSKNDPLLKNIEGFRTLFGEGITFKPKIGKKLDGEFKNKSFEELMKLEKK